MEHGYIYTGIGTSVVIIGTFLIFQLGSNQPEQSTFTNPMNVTDVIHNLDSLYDKRITVSGYWYDTIGGGVELAGCGEIVGNNYLTNAKPSTVDLLLVNLPNNEYLFKDQNPVKHRGDFVMVSGILKNDTRICRGDSYETPILQANSDQIR